MDTASKVIGFSGANPTAPTATATATDGSTSVARAYLLDADSMGVVRGCFADLGFANHDVVHGSIDTAIDELPRRGWPHFLIVDVSGISDPLPRMARLAEVCNLETEVVVVGDLNDIVLYRNLKARGVAEYFFKPLVGSVVSHTLGEIATGNRNPQPTRSGKLLFILGVRGGVGVTTITTNLAWNFAEVRERPVLLLDLDLYSGDAALQLEAQPSHALREALDDPKRIDELFLERGVAMATSRLGLLAGIESLSTRLPLNEDAVMQLLQQILGHYRYVLVDLPGEVALTLPALLHIPSTLLLVSDGTLTNIREVARWREFLGPNTPDRTLLHVLNKAHAAGALPEEEMLRVIPAPDVSIRWDREIMSGSALGTKAMQDCHTLQQGIAALSALLSGAVAEEDRPLWKRLFS